jgi:hypothetical protein
MMQTEISDLAGKKRAVSPNVSPCTIASLA